MSNDKKVTIKTFLRKAGGKISATAFLAQHREFMTTGALAEITNPILLRLDKGEILPTPALEAISQAVLAHHIQVEAKAAEAWIESGKESATAKEPKNYLCTVYTVKGEVATRTDEHGNEVEIEASFDLPQDGIRFLDRRLVDGASDNFGVLLSTKITIAGEPMSEVVMRQDSLARLLKAPKHPFSKKTGSRDNRLSFGTKCHQSHAYFSHG